MSSHLEVADSQVHRHTVWRKAKTITTEVIYPLTKSQRIIKIFYWCNMFIANKKIDTNWWGKHIQSSEALGIITIHNDCSNRLNMRWIKWDFGLQSDRKSENVAPVPSQRHVLQHNIAHQTVALQEQNCLRADGVIRIPYYQRHVVYIQPNSWFKKNNNNSVCSYR